MKYLIGKETFNKKSEITQRARSILSSISSRSRITDGDDYDFLINIFKYHHEWKKKSKKRVVGIEKMMTQQGSACFALILKDNSYIDISFVKAIQDIPTSSNRKNSNNLNDYKKAARNAIEDQIRDFKTCFVEGMKCECSGEILFRGNFHVDHKPPKTFDFILNQFTIENDIDPETIEITSINGTIHHIKDDEIREKWLRYHEEKCDLRLISKDSNLRLPKRKVEWHKTTG